MIASAREREQAPIGAGRIRDVRTQNGNQPRATIRRLERARKRLRGVGCRVDGSSSGSPVEENEPELSLVIPAFNEEDRLADTLSAVSSYVTSQNLTIEVILVDDGSTDSTAAIAHRAAHQVPWLQVLTILHRGKAAALRAGMLSARGALVAFSDADLATPLGFLEDLRRAVANGCDVAIGSREGLGARRVGEPHYRHVMGRGFNWLVRILVLPGIQDTQCGFKLFRREVAAKVLERSRLYADPSETISGPRVTAFDVEILVVARRLGYRICPIPVVWTYGDHSKVNPARDTWHNLMDVLRVRINDWRGYYR